MEEGGTGGAPERDPGLTIDPLTAARDVAHGPQQLTGRHSPESRSHPSVGSGTSAEVRGVLGDSIAQT